MAGSNIAGVSKTLPAKLATIPVVRPWPLKGVRDLTILYFPGVALFQKQREDLEGNNSVKRTLIAAEIDKKREQIDRLHWRIIAHTSSKLLPLATQRNKLRRKWTAAMIISLRKRGLGFDGSRYTGKSADGLVAAARDVQELYGTMEVLVHNAAKFGCPTEEIVQSTDKIVDALIVGGTGTRKFKPDAQNKRVENDSKGMEVLQPRLFQRARSDSVD